MQIRRQNLRRKPNEYDDDYEDEDDQDDDEYDYENPPKKGGPIRPRRLSSGRVIMQDGE